ncbi:MAG: hypothetical protein M9933_17325 [Chitinophagaceae bacterium]|nr:hypothetical protein [Chitinophagaceae bacterium]
MNKNIWNLYKNSERGKETIDLFSFDIGLNNAKFEDSYLEKKAEIIGQKYGEFLGIEDDDYVGCI